jgi:hypothetical protein
VINVIGELGLLAKSYLIADGVNKPTADIRGRGHPVALKKVH